VNRGELPCDGKGCSPSINQGKAPPRDLLTLVEKGAAGVMHFEGKRLYGGNRMVPALQVAIAELSNGLAATGVSLV
jgi:hypothetical protein